MTLFVVVLTLSLLALLGVAVVIPYICAVVTGRALASVFHVEADQSAREVDELLSPEPTAEFDALVVRSQRMAYDAQRRADAWPSAR